MSEQDSKDKTSMSELERKVVALKIAVSVYEEEGNTEAATAARETLAEIEEKLASRRSAA